MRVVLLLVIVGAAFALPAQNKSNPPAREYAFFTDANGNSVMFPLKGMKVTHGSFVGGYKNKVKFYLYTKENSDIDDYQQLYKDDNDSIANSNFDRSKKTVVIAHGYMNDFSSGSIQDIKNNLLQVEDVNVIAVDWSAIADNIIYSISAAETYTVGNYVGQFLKYLVNLGMSPDNLHIVGHSLGAHVAGLTGKSLQKLGSTAARITGLDPALPGFDDVSTIFRISNTDATYVDCIHTDGGFLGYDSPLCDADFYPNGGVNVQPGCPVLDLGSCSHGRSYEFFAESILPGHLFPTEICSGMGDVSPTNCTTSSALMGYPSTIQNQGIFSGTTNSQSPYSPNV